MTVLDRKAVVECLVDELGRSERRACALTSQPRSTSHRASSTDVALDMIVAPVSCTRSTKFDDGSPK